MQWVKVQFKSACNESPVSHLKLAVLQIPVADLLSSASAVVECVAEDDHDATSSEFEAKTESGEVAAYSANDPLLIVSSREENEMENVI